MSDIGDKKKTLLYLGLGLGALVTSALVFNYLSGGESNQKVIEELDELGTVKRQGHVIEFKYYKDLFAVIAKHSKIRFAEKKKEFLTRRRAALKAGNNAEYKQIVQEQMMQEEKHFTDLMQEATEHLNITDQEFMETQ